MNDNKILLKYLKSQHIMIMSTFSRRIWSSILIYAIDHKFNIYFISEDDSVHSNDIKKNNKIACGICDSRQKVTDKKIGVQISGVVSKIFGKKDIIYALRLWNRSNSGIENIIRYDNMKQINSSVYRIRPVMVKFFNEKLYGQEGFKVLNFK